MDELLSESIPLFRTNPKWARPVSLILAQHLRESAILGHEICEDWCLEGRGGVPQSVEL